MICCKGEESSTDLSKFLNFSKSGADTVLKVSTDGNLGTTGSNYDQLITFKGVDLTAGHSLTTTADSERLDQGADRSRQAQDRPQLISRPRRGQAEVLKYQVFCLFARL